MEKIIQKEIEEPQLSAHLWQNLFEYLKPLKGIFIKVGLSMFGIAMLDTLIPLLTRYTIDEFILKNTVDGLWIFAIIYFIAGGLIALFVFAFHYYAADIEYHITLILREKAFKHLQILPFGYYDKTPTGYMMSRLTSDIDRIGETVAWSLIDIVWSVLTIIFVSVAMLIVNFKLGLITLSVLPFLVAVTIYFQERILKSARFSKKVNSHITTAYNEGIVGAKSTKSLVSEDIQFREFDELSTLYKKKSLRLVHFTALYTPCVIALGGISLALILQFGGMDVSSGVITFGTLNLFVAYSVQFFEPLRELSTVYGALQSTQASVERVLNLINTPLTLKDNQEILEKYGDVFHPKRENWENFEGDITFKHVDFYYIKEEPILKDFSFSVKAGQTIALVGETGSGKSTLVNLACRFYEPINGQILFDGVDYKQRSQLWVQDQIGYVLQTPHLFSGTIRENILFGKPNATEDEIINACKLTNAYDFILKLENGFDTEVGESGAKLSTGEKQLISFARAMIKDPKLFVLDEATSSIDTHTEKLIQDAIDHVLKDRTSFIIAHRLSTIKSADVILVLKKGIIIESGSHDQLMKQQGYYYDLYTHQYFAEDD